MIVEFEFMSSGREPHKCYIALCDEPIETIEDVVWKYWNSHGINAEDFGSFVFHRNENDEYVVLTYCTEINTTALDYCLTRLQAFVGARCNATDLLRIVREFDKLEKNDTTA